MVVVISSPKNAKVVWSSPVVPIFHFKLCRGELQTTGELESSICLNFHWAVEYVVIIRVWAVDITFDGWVFVVQL